MGMLAACSRLNEYVPDQKPVLDEEELVERVIFEVPDLLFLGEDGETKASLSQDGDAGIRFSWEATDTVGIYPDSGAQVYLSMADGVGTNTATFNGGGWALRKGSTYSCYFPFVGRTYLDRNVIPVSFANQVQTGVSNHEGVRYYLASKGDSDPESGDLHFSFSILNTIIRLRVVGLPAGTYTKLTLSTDEPLFVQNGSFGLDDMTITGVSFSNSLEVSLKDFILTEASTDDNPVLFYISSAPVDLSGKTLTVRVFSDDDSIFKYERVSSTTYVANSWGGFKCQMKKESVIFYTSSDNSIVTPTDPDAFGGATIVSNVYDGSRGILAFDTNVTQIGNHAFENCETLTGITIPETVTSIGDYAFAGCTNLGANNTPASMSQMFRTPSPFRSGETSIVIPDTVTSIGNYAFQNCTSLTSITIPDSVTDIGESLFSGCKGLASIMIPYGVTSIDDSAFAGCVDLIDIDIPSTVTSIGKSAFKECAGLTSIILPQKVASIGESAFEDCENLVSINIPAGISRIENRTFASCMTLPGIIIPESVTSIGSSAFEACHRLSDITIPSSVISIGSSAFAYCESLTSIVLPPQLTIIDLDLFEGSALTSITIPDSIVSINEGAFNGCTDLTHITVHAINPPSDVTESTFEYTNDCLIYVPSGSLNAYKSATGWSNYASRICDHVYVEMGNGMKWATTNVGAIGPDDYGDYFTWGGTEPVTPSSNSSAGTFTDMANAIWGGSWRMPTYAEWEALMNDENYDWTWDYAKDGYTVVSRVPGYVGNTIFLPAAGTVGEEEIMGDGWDGYYWSSSLHPDSGYGWGLLFEHSIESVYMGRYVLHGGCSVRPIFESNPNGGLEKPNDTGIEIDL